jgi:hypothetical protein
MSVQMANRKQWDSEGMDTTLTNDNNVPSGIMESVQQDLDRMPYREVLDYLIQYFLSELNWQVFSPLDNITNISSIAASEQGLIINEPG